MGPGCFQGWSSGPEQPADGQPAPVSTGTVHQGKAGARLRWARRPRVRQRGVRGRLGLSLGGPDRERDGRSPRWGCSGRSTLRGCAAPDADVALVGFAVLQTRGSVARRQHDGSKKLPRTSHDFTPAAKTSYDRGRASSLQRERSWNRWAFRRSNNPSRGSFPSLAALRRRGLH